MSKEKTEKQKKKAGRPRSEKARKAILEAARNLLNDLGPGRLTVEAVAQKARVGKPTIYRYWANAQELAMSALMEGADQLSDEDAEKSNRQKLEDLVSEILERLNSKRGRQMALILAGAEADSEIFKAFSNKVILEGRARGLDILKQAKSSGEIEDTADPGILIDMVLGVIFLRLLLGHDELKTDLAMEAVKKIWGT
ncbi:MAG: TetR/AcrR family transcriptional regulator [Sneathiellales bacterium]|nr:TetR/AcrR family transcriptional regulator [Sneathiellales bacterium]